MQHPVLLVGAVWAWGEVVGCFTAALPSENKAQEADGCRGKQWGRAVSMVGWSPGTPTASLLTEPGSVSCPGESSWWTWSVQGACKYLWGSSFVSGIKHWAGVGEMWHCLWPAFSFPSQASGALHHSPVPLGICGGSLHPRDSWQQGLGQV